MALQQYPARGCSLSSVGVYTNRLIALHTMSRSLSFWSFCVVPRAEVKSLKQEPQITSTSSSNIERNNNLMCRSLLKVMLRPRCMSDIRSSC